MFIALYFVCTKLTLKNLIRNFILNAKPRLFAPGPLAAVGTGRAKNLTTVQLSFDYLNTHSY